MYIYISGWHTCDFGCMSSLVVTRWHRWCSQQMWRRFWWPLSESLWWRCTCALRLLPVWEFCAVPLYQGRQPSVWFSRSIASCLPIPAFTTSFQWKSSPCFFSSRTSVRGFFISYCVASIVPRDNPRLAILAILKASRMSDCSSSTQPPYLDIVADMLNSYKKSVAVSTYQIWLLPPPYTLPWHPLRWSKPVAFTLGDDWHWIRPLTSQSWKQHDVQFRGMCGQMLSPTQEVSHCGRLLVGHAALIVCQLYVISLLDGRQPRYNNTHIQLCAACYPCCFWFSGELFTVFPEWYLPWQHWECCGGQSGSWIEVGPQLVVYWMKRSSFCSIPIHSHLAAVSVQPWFAGVEVKRWWWPKEVGSPGKLITKWSAKSWGLYSYLHVKMECRIANLHVLQKIYPAVDSCMSRGFPTVLRVAASWPKVGWEFLGTDGGERQLKSGVCEIYTAHSSMEGTSVDVCLKNPWDLSSHRGYTSCNDARLALLFPMEWWWKRRFCFVQVDYVYQPWHKRCSFSPCGPYLATSNISPINKVNANTMVNAPKKNLPSLLAGKWGKSAKQSTRQSHLTIECQSGFEADRVRAQRAVCSFRSKKKLAVGTRREMHFLSNEEKDNWIGDSVDRETSVARKGVEDTETAIEQEQEDMGNAEKAGLTTTKPVTTFEEMLNAIGVSLSDLASSDDREDGEVENDDDDDPDVGRLSVDDEPSWVMGTIPKRDSIAWSVFGRSWWPFPNGCNHSGETWPTTSGREIRSMGWPNWSFRVVLNLKRKMMQLHLRRQHLVSIWRILIVS